MCHQEFFFTTQEELTEKFVVLKISECCFGIRLHSFFLMKKVYFTTLTYLFCLYYNPLNKI
jgi:hypothetical protein